VGAGAGGLILDTKAVSSLAKEEADVLAVLNAASAVVLPLPVIGDYRYGIALSQVRMRLSTWFERLLADCSVVDVTNETTHHYAAIRVELRKIGKAIPVNVIWIAALCRQHSFPLLSRDRHFDAVPGLERLEW
jgi:tRNA(fMet)-specific endonuclease VapC